MPGPIRLPDGRAAVGPAGVTRSASIDSAPVRAVVTGGAGFIGSNIVDALVARGAEVLVVDDLSHGSVGNLEGALAKGTELAEIDIRDAEAVRKAVTTFRPDVLCHLAAQIDVRVSMAEPALDATTKAWLDQATAELKA